MSRHLGPIVKLNRMRQDYTLEYVSKKSGISISKLSDFENKKVQLMERDIWELYRIIGLDYHSHSYVDEYVEERFQTLFHHIVYQKELDACFQESDERIYEIQMSLSYPKYLLMELLYHLYAGYEYPYEKQFALIKNHLDYLEDYQIPIFYDAFGVYHKNNHEYEEALKWFLKAMQIHVDDTVSSLVCYHMAQPLLYLGRMKEASIYLSKAVDLFAKELNFKRMAKANDTLGICNDAMGDYKQAQDIYRKSIIAFKNLGLNEDALIAYNNLIWSCVLSGSYQEVLKYGQELLKEKDNQGSVYFYMAYAYSKINQKEEAKLLIRMAKQHLEEENKYMRSMIDTFYTLLSEQKSYDLKGKKLLRTYKEAKKCGDSQVMIFVLDMLVEHYESQQDLLLMVQYLKEQISIYKKRR